MFDTNDIKDKLQKIASSNNEKANECKEALNYIEGLERRLQALCEHNGAYKNRMNELAYALELIVHRHCSIGDKLSHMNIAENKAAFKALGIQEGMKVEILEDLIKEHQL